jgi:protocatechuate 3,4-dioxygenase beta subunit
MADAADRRGARTRRQRLDQLIVASPCSESWDAMSGDERSRFCASCRRTVHDFRFLSPREIEARLQASRGHLCARLTRDAAGRLLTADPPWVAIGAESRRPHPAAAALVSFWLGASALAASEPVSPAPTSSEVGADREPERRAAERIPSPKPAPLGAALRGRVTDDQAHPLPGAAVSARESLGGRELHAVSDADGAFAFENLEPGMYEIEASREGYSTVGLGGIALGAGDERTESLPLTVQEELIGVSGGIMVATAEPIRVRFAHSSIVVLAAVGETSPLGARDSYREVATELVVEETFRGELSGESILLRHAVGAGENAEADTTFVPGATVLAFLEPSSANGDDEPEGTYRTAGWQEPRVLADDEIDAFRDRVEALAELDAGSSPEPSQVVAWWIDTIVDPVTRGEAASDLGGALGALDRLAAEQGLSTEALTAKVTEVRRQFLESGGEPSSDLSQVQLAAAVTDADRDRLTDALAATERMTVGDLDLFALVRRWDPVAASRWLRAAARSAVAVEANPGVGADGDGEAREFDRGLWSRVADGLGEPALSAAIEDYDDRTDDLWTAYSEAHPDGTGREIEGELVALGTEARRRIATLLGDRSSAPRVATEAGEGEPSEP